MIEIKNTIGENYRVNLDDVYKVKWALNDTGHYKIPNYGLTPYPDIRLFDAIKLFQKDNDLKIDGVMKPEGETIVALSKRKDVENPDVKRPDSKCSVCGGSHGDLCPDCASK